MLTFLIRAILLCLTFASAYPAAAATGDQEFKQGITAFRAGHYDQAITAFKQAQAKGKKSSALTYNLGVCYFKTRQYDNAKQSFSRLLSIKAFRQLAQYNLGLVNEEQQNKQTAISWFRKAANEQGEPKITALAMQKLEKYTGNKNLRHLSGLLSVGYGHDSNVTLASTGAPTQQADNYLQLFGFVSIPAGPVTINASLYQQDYQTINTADFMQLSAGVVYPIRTRTWLFSPAIYLAKDTLNSSDFLSVTDFKLAAEKPLSVHSKLLLRYRYSDISADNTSYQYLQGSRHQFRIQDSLPTQLGQLRLRYELEINNRQNLSTANYSPTRHLFLVRLKQKFSDWEFKEQFSWRNSQYGEAAGIKRDDKRTQMSLVAQTQLAKNLRAGARYEYTDNKSNVTIQTYNRNDIRAYLNYLF